MKHGLHDMELFLVQAAAKASSPPPGTRSRSKQRRIAVGGWCWEGGRYLACSWPFGALSSCRLVEASFPLPGSPGGPLRMISALLLPRAGGFVYLKGFKEWEATSIERGYSHVQPGRRPHGDHSFIPSPPPCPPVGAPSRRLACRVWLGKRQQGDFTYY